MVWQTAGHDDGTAPLIPAHGMQKQVNLSELKTSQGY